MEINLKYLYKDNSAFINSLLLNIRNDLSSDENDMLTRTGTTHIISISGLHIGILSGALVFIIGKINKIHKLVLIVIIMILYSFLVGNIPSMKRAIFFSIIAYSAFFLDKKVDGISTLSFIGTFLIIENPYIIYNLSFQLSFLATLSIIYFYGYINNIIKFNLLSLTIAANILTLPIVYYNFNIISIISVISNIVVVPLIGVIIYIAISSLIIFEFNVEIAKIIAYTGNTIIDLIYFILDKMANIKFAYIEVDNPNIYYMMIYYVIVFLYMIYNEMKIVKEQKNELQGYYKQYKI